MKYLLLFFYCLLLYACGGPGPNQALNHALDLARENRHELEKVLEHYKDKDSLKYLAAVFLIENMPGKYARVFPDYDSYTPAFDTLEAMGTAYEKDGVNMEFYKNYKETAFNFFLEEHHLEPTDHLSFLKKEDIQTITADYLEENIDYAFKAWEMPWNKHLSFSEFCEFILPYRYANEELQPWRKIYFEKNKYLLDSLKGVQDPVKAAMFLKRLDYKSRSEMAELRGLMNAIKPLDLIRINTHTNCVDESGQILLRLRGLGVPVARLHIPYWGNRGEGHDITGVLTADKKWVGFGSGGDTAPYQPPTIPVRFEITKVYAQIYGNNDTSSALFSLNDLYLSDPRYIDVTAFITEATNISLPLSSPAGNSTACLCVFDNFNWIPIMQTPIVNKHADFKQIGKRIIYLAGTLTSGALTLEDAPFFLDSNNIIHILKPSGNIQTLTLTRKYPANTGLEDKIPSMTGSYFQGSNDSGFIRARTLWKISNLADLRTRDTDITNATYRYVRLVIPPAERQNEGLGGIGFYGTDSMHKYLLSGEPISLVKASNTFYSRVFDGDPTTFVMVLNRKVADFPQFFDGENLIVPDKTPFWVGLQFKKPEKITSLQFSPRTDDNDVNIGETYQLYYWNNRGWVSLGRKKATENQLKFNGPAEALYYLVDVDKGKENRLFLYKNNQQIWY